MLLDDTVLLERSKQGDEESYGQLAERYRKYLARVAYSHCKNRDTAEEVVQWGLAHAWEKIRNCQFDFKSWATRIVERRAWHVGKTDAKRRSREQEFVRAQKEACRQNGRPCSHQRQGMIEHADATEDGGDEYWATFIHANNVLSPTTKGRARVKQFVKKYLEIKCVDMSGRGPASIALEELVQEDGREITPANKKRMEKDILGTMRYHGIDRREFLSVGAGVVGFWNAPSGADRPFERVDLNALMKRLGEHYSCLRRVHWGAAEEDTWTAANAMRLARRDLQTCLRLDLLDLDRSQRALIGKFTGRMAGDLKSFVGAEALDESNFAFRFAMNCANFLENKDHDLDEAAFVRGIAYQNGNAAGLHVSAHESHQPFHVEVLLRQFEWSKRAWEQVPAKRPDMNGNVGAYGPNGWNTRAQTLFRIQTLIQGGPAFWHRAEVLIKEANAWSGMHAFTEGRLLIVQAKLLEKQGQTIKAIEFLQQAGDVFARFYGNRHHHKYAATVLLRAFLGDRDDAELDEALSVFFRTGLRNLEHVNSDRVRNEFRH